MKKIVSLILFLCVSILCFTSCQVNWFGEQYTVPWWVIAIPSVMIVAVALLLSGKNIASKKYVCPECGKKFYPHFWNAMFSVHMNDDRVLKCPHCGRRGFCHSARDTENE